MTRSTVIREKKGVQPLHALSMLFMLAMAVIYIVIKVGKDGPSDSSVSSLPIGLQHSQQHAEEDGTDGRSSSRPT